MAVGRVSMHTDTHDAEDLVSAADQAAVKAYLQLVARGLTLSEIAVALGMSRSGLRLWRLRVGLPVRAQADPLRDKGLSLLRRGLSVVEVAARLKVRVFTVHGWVQRQRSAGDGVPAGLGLPRPIKVNGPRPARRARGMLHLRRGDSPAHVAALLGVTRQTARRWQQALGLSAGERGPQVPLAALELFQIGQRPRLIARRLELPTRTVDGWRRALGLPASYWRPTPGEVLALVQAGLSQEVVGQRLGVSRYLVRRLLAEAHAAAGPESAGPESAEPPRGEIE